MFRRQSASTKPQRTCSITIIRLLEYVRLEIYRQRRTIPQNRLKLQSLSTFQRITDLSRARGFSFPDYYETLPISRPPSELANEI